MLCMTGDAVLNCAPTVIKPNSQMFKLLFQNHQMNLKTYRLLFLSLTTCFCTEGCSMPWRVSYILHPNIVIYLFWLLNNLCQFFSGNWLTSSCFSHIIISLMVCNQKNTSPVTLVTQKIEEKLVLAQNLTIITVRSRLSECWVLRCFLSRLRIQSWIF